MMSSDWKNESSLSIIYDDPDVPSIADVLKIYDSMLTNNFPPPMFFESSKYFMKKCVEFVDFDGNKTGDPHPTPDKYKKYLNEIGFPLTERSEKYVNRCMDLLSKVKHQREFAEYFAEEEKTRVKGLSGVVLF